MAGKIISDPTIVELESFSEQNLNVWSEAARDLDELVNLIHYGTQPSRLRYWPELIEAAQIVDSCRIELSDWFRVVTLKYCNDPLSPKGSLIQAGRFNLGTNLDCTSHSAWPALYIGEDYDTAFREKYQIGRDDNINGLTAEDLSLSKIGSHASFKIKGELCNIFDMTNKKNLDPLAKALGKVKLPSTVNALKARIDRFKKQKYQPMMMIKTSNQLYDSIFSVNWRNLPVSFDVPSHSQIVAEIIKCAGYEGILYNSTKGTKRCIAIFPEKITPTSYIELSDECPESIINKRMDSSNISIYV